MAGKLVVFVSADSSLSTQSFFVSSHNASPKERGKALHDEPKTVGRKRGSVEHSGVTCRVRDLLRNANSLTNACGSSGSDDIKERKR